MEKPEQLRSAQRDQGPILWQPNSTVPGCSLPVDDHLLVIFAFFCADSIPAMVAPPRRPPFAMCGLRAPGPLGDRTLPTQA